MVEAMLPRALEAVDDALDSLGVIQRERDETAARVADVEAAARASVAALLDDGEMSWLDSGELALLPRTSTPIGEQIAALATLERVAARLSRMLVETLNDIQSLEQALEDLAGRLRTMNIGEVPAGRLAFAVRRHYESVFSQELAEVEELRKALFDGSEKIQVDLREMSVAWLTPEGAQQSRPLEAFSSGQRAFAYTRVQMERQGDDRARNRLLVLDEFGAFIAQDRFDVLVRYLRERAIGRLADQIVLILPTRQRAGEPPAQPPAFEGNGYVVNVLG
jgi:prefoldin subunit 5